MMPEEFEHKDTSHFTLRLNVSCLPTETKQNNNKGYDHYKEQGLKVFHFEVTKEDINYFKFLSSHAHRFRLDNECYGKFAKFTATLGNNAPISVCVSLRQCIQGHLNFHLSLTCIVIHGIDELDASKILRNPANNRPIGKFTLQDLLYCIKLESKAPLFLQLSQCYTGEVDAVIPNTPEAELMAERMNVQIATWCHYYWKETNPGADRFYHKLSNRAFNQVLIHKISECTWDPKLKAVISLRAQSDMAAIADFEQQDCVKQLTQDGYCQSSTKKHVDPNVAFPFQDEFSVGTIHGANTKATIPTAQEVVEIKGNVEGTSNPTTKTSKGVQSEVIVGSRVASGSNPISGPTTNSYPPGAASGGSDDPSSVRPAGRAKGEPSSE
jgi:hypothetical protein